MENVAYDFFQTGMQCLFRCDIFVQIKRKIGKFYNLFQDRYCGMPYSPMHDIIIQWLRKGRKQGHFGIFIELRKIDITRVYSSKCFTLWKHGQRTTIRVDSRH